jgi:acetyltransferase
MATRLRHHHPDATVEGYLLQQMVEGVELILGVRDDPQYGPIMIVGLGGILVEALDDVALRLLPVDATAANSMLRSLRGFVLLDGFRNRARCDIEAVISAMVALSDIFLAHRSWLSDLEINPLIVLPDGEGVRAADVRLVTSRN